MFVIPLESASSSPVAIALTTTATAPGTPIAKGELLQGKTSLAHVCTFILLKVEHSTKYRTL